MTAAPQLAYGTHIFDAVVALAQAARGGEDLGRLDRAPLRRRRRRQHDHAGRRSSRPRSSRTSACSRSGFAPARSTRKTLQTLADADGRLVRRGIVAEGARRHLLAARQPSSRRSTCSSTARSPRRARRSTSRSRSTASAPATSHYTAPTPSELPPYHRPFIRRFVLSGWSLLLLALVVAGLIAVAVRLLARRGALAVRRSDSAVLRRLERSRRRRQAEGGRGLAASCDARPRLGLGRGARLARAARRAARHRPDQGLVDDDHRRHDRCATLVAVVLLGTISVFFAVLGLGTPLRHARVGSLEGEEGARGVRRPAAAEPPGARVRPSRRLHAARRVRRDGRERERAVEERVRAASITDERLGVPLEDAIRRVSVRMASRDLEQVAMLAELLRTTGGNAAEVLDVIVLHRSRARTTSGGSFGR